MAIEKQIFEFGIPAAVFCIVFFFGINSLVSTGFTNRGGTLLITLCVALLSAFGVWEIITKPIYQSEQIDRPSESFPLSVILLPAAAMGITLVLVLPLVLVLQLIRMRRRRKVEDIIQKYSGQP